MVHAVLITLCVALLLLTVYETATPSLEAHIDTFTAMSSYLIFTCWVSHFSMKIRFLAYYS
jgi:hypothetical protein